MGEKWLPVALSYQGPVVRVLGLDQRIQILARRENFASGLCAIKLAAIALYGSQFAFELLADVHHEGRLDWVLSIRERVEQLVGTVRGSSCGISLQAGEVARVPSQFRGHAVIRHSAAHLLPESWPPARPLPLEVRHCRASRSLPR